MSVRARVAGCYHIKWAHAGVEVCSAVKEYTPVAWVRIFAEWYAANGAYSSPAGATRHYHKRFNQWQHSSESCAIIGWSALIAPLRVSKKYPNSQNWTTVISDVDSYFVSRFPHDDVIKWKHFPRYWPFLWGIYRWPVNSPHKSQWRKALMFSLIYAWITSWVKNRKAGDLNAIVLIMTSL